MDHAGKKIGIQFKSGEEFDHAKNILQKDMKSDRIFIPFEDRILFIDETQKNLLDVSMVSYRMLDNQ